MCFPLDWVCIFLITLSFPAFLSFSTFIITKYEIIKIRYTIPTIYLDYQWKKHFIIIFFVLPRWLNDYHSYNFDVSKLTTAKANRKWCHWSRLVVWIHLCKCLRWHLYTFLHSLCWFHTVYHHRRLIRSPNQLHKYLHD